MPTKPICPVCKANAADTSEHIWPRWFLKRMDKQGVPPTIWSKDGTVILDRNDRPVQRPTRTRSLIDICDACNTTLNARFEEPAKLVIERLALSNWQAELTAAEWQIVGLWWAKVLLLLAHPDARYGDELLNEQARMPFDGATPDYTWMLSGPQIPTDISVFVCNADLNDESVATNLAVPIIVTHADGTRTTCHVTNFATSGLGVNVVSHPGVTIDHPMVNEGEAWELLRGAPAQESLSSLPTRGYHHTALIPVGGAEAGYVVERDGDTITDYESDLGFHD